MGLLHCRQILYHLSHPPANYEGTDPIVIAPPSWPKYCPKANLQIPSYYGFNLNFGEKTNLQSRADNEEDNYGLLKAQNLSDFNLATWFSNEDEMVGWQYLLSGHESEQTLGDSEGQGSLTCCSS